MFVYPQLGSGALSQFPLRKRRRMRTVVNRAADGRAIRLPDTPAEVIEWQLEYADLSDDEMAAIRQFFESVEGTLNGFTFLDPTSNLLAWSDQLGNAVWQKGPLLTIASGVADPFGETKAWAIANQGAGAQALMQTLAAPAGYQYCLSAHLRANQATTVTLLAGSQRAERAVDSQWTRATFSASGDPTGESIGFGLELPAGAGVEVFGIQAEPQSGASGYKPSTTGGTFENARLRDDLLTITTTGVNRHSCTINIIHANHL